MDAEKAKCSVFQLIGAKESIRTHKLHTENPYFKGATRLTKTYLLKMAVKTLCVCVPQNLYNEVMN